MKIAFSEPPPAKIWRSLEAWPEHLRPAGLWPLITGTTSLTTKLRERAGEDFHLRVLSEHELRVDPEDAALIEAEAGEHGYGREVYLCGDQPWVYARSMGVTSQGGDRWLKELGARSLGERAFAEQGTVRGLIQAAQVGAGHALYEGAVSGLRERPLQPFLWARRSVLSVGKARLLIYECFLPGLAL